jgi:hypothetical protein
MNDFKNGVADAESDIRGGWLPMGGPTEKPTFPSLDYIVNELRVGVGASDAYIAGYVSVVYGG